MYKAAGSWNLGTGIFGSLGWILCLLDLSKL